MIFKYKKSPFLGLNSYFGFYGTKYKKTPSLRGRNYEDESLFISLAVKRLDIYII